MNKMSYWKFLFSDKKSQPYWWFVSFLLILLVLYNYLRTSDNKIFFFFLLYILVYLLYYLNSYLNYIKFFSIAIFLGKRKEHIKLDQCLIEIQPQILTLTSLKQNYYAKVKLNSYQEYCFHIQTNEFFILSYFVRSLGIFQRYEVPLIICQNDEYPAYLNGFHLCQIMKDSITVKDDNIFIKISGNKRIKLIDGMEMNILG